MFHMGGGGNRIPPPFTNTQNINPYNNCHTPAIQYNWPPLAVSWDLGIVQATEKVTKQLTVIYDQII